MRVNSRKNAELLEQYPFLPRIVKLPLKPLGTDDSSRSNLDHLIITVEKADGDLLYRKADNLGIIDNSCMLAMKGRHKDLVGKRAEYLFALDEHGTVLQCVEWPKGRDVARGKPPLYAWSALWGVHTNTGFSHPHFDRTKYLVWVRVETWHEHTRDSMNPFGELRTREMRITIYGEPEQGFKKLQEEANVYDNLFLDSHTLMIAAIDKNYDITVINGHLGELCHFFQSEVYFSGMKDILDASEYRGASGQFGSAEVLVAEMCGYDRVMLQNNVCWVTYQLRPNASDMYVLGCGGTLPQIRELTMSVVRAWREPGNRKRFAPNKEVSVM